MSDDQNYELKKVTEQEWREISLRLLHYAKIKCRILPGDLEPQDVAIDAITLALTGQRKWNTTVYPELYDFLVNVVDSLFSNLWRKKAHKRFTSNEVVVENATDKLSKENYEKSLSATESDESGHEFDKRLKLVEAASTGDPELEDFYLALESGCASIKEIAAMLEWTLNKTYKVRTKLRAKLEEQERTKVVQHG